MAEELQHTGEQQLEQADNRGAFQSAANFDLAQRMAKMLANSQLVPQHYQGKIADCVIALEMANRIGASPMAVLQNMYIVHGKPAWSSQFLISCLNASGKFSPLRYKTDGEGDDYGCIAWAKDKADDEVLEGPKVTIGMAKAEGWFDKNGSKWKTMPELMLRYRAATLFARLYAPELTMGIMTENEVVDISPAVTEHPAPTNETEDPTQRLQQKVNQQPAQQQQTEQPEQSEQQTQSAKHTSGPAPRTPAINEITSQMGVKQSDLKDYCVAEQMLDEGSGLGDLTKDQRWKLWDNAEWFGQEVGNFVEQTENGVTTTEAASNPQENKSEDLNLNSE